MASLPTTEGAVQRDIDFGHGRLKQLALSECVPGKWFAQLRLWMPQPGCELADFSYPYDHAVYFVHSGWGHFRIAGSEDQAFQAGDYKEIPAGTQYWVVPGAFQQVNIFVVFQSSVLQTGYGTGRR